MSLTHHFLTMAWNNAWANLRLLRAVAALDDAAFRAPRTGFFPSLAGTLNHIVTVDWYYVDALERALVGAEPNHEYARFFETREPFARVSELKAAQRSVDLRLVEVCRALPEGRLKDPVRIVRGQGVTRETFTRVLAHLFEHQIHHRGQAHAMLSGTQVPPPQLDEFFCENDAQLRARDLSELGIDEAALWGPQTPT